MRPRAAEIILGALALALSSGSVGLVHNHLASSPLPLMAAFRAPLPAGIEGVEPAAALDLFEEGSAVFLDVREVERFREGHVPGAWSVPAEGLDQYLQGRSRQALLTGLALRPLVLVYCDGPECQASGRVARALREAGVAQVRVMSGGWPAWEQAGHPTSREVDR